MKKHRYSATDIMRIDWSALVEQTAGERLVLGVDVAKEDFFGVLMRTDLEKGVGSCVLPFGVGKR